MTDKPTMELRFVEREKLHYMGDMVVSIGSIKILQQKWECADGTEQWRDVPVGKETE